MASPERTASPQFPPRYLTPRRSILEESYIHTIWKEKKELRQRFLAANSEVWEIILPIIPREYSYPQSNADKELSYEAFLKIKDLQNPLIKDPVQEHHTKSIQFFLENWDKIRNLIKPSDNSIYPYRAAEVDFKEHGRADFIGFFGDGSIAIVEFGLSQKYRQPGRHAYGLSRAIGNCFDIYPYNARVQKEHGINSLRMNLNLGSIDGKKDSHL